MLDPLLGCSLVQHVLLLELALEAAAAGACPLPGLHRVLLGLALELRHLLHGQAAAELEVLVGALSVPVALAVLAECPAELGLEVRLGATDQQAGLDGGERACHGGVRSKIWSKLVTNCHAN